MLLTHHERHTHTHTLFDILFAVNNLMKLAMLSEPNRRTYARTHPPKTTKTELATDAEFVAFFRLNN